MSVNHRGTVAHGNRNEWLFCLLLSPKWAAVFHWRRIEWLFVPFGVCFDFHAQEFKNSDPKTFYTSEPAFLLGLRFPFTVKYKALSYNPTNELRIYFITRYYISDEILTNEWNFAKRQLYEFQTVQLRETSNSDCQQSTTLIHRKPTAVTAPSTQLSGEVSYISVLWVHEAPNQINKGLLNCK